MATTTTGVTAWCAGAIAGAIVAASLMLTGCQLVTSDGDDDDNEGDGSVPVACDSPVDASNAPQLDGLLAVFSLPQGEAASDDTILYSMTLPAASSSTAGKQAAGKQALRAGGESPADAPRSGRAARDPKWQARLAYESTRRRAIDRLIDDLHAGRRSLRRARGRQATCGDCGNTMMCWQGECTAQVDVSLADGATTVSTQLVDVIDLGGGILLNVLLDAQVASATTTTAATSAANAFGSTLATQLALLGLEGHTGALDHDQDGRMTVVFTNESGGDPALAALVGFFDYRDVLGFGQTDANGNDADLLWVRVPGTATATVTETEAVGTMVHEYTHLVSYALRVAARDSDALRETLWLDEGMAHLMEDLSGWGPSNIAVVSDALLAWGEGPFAGSDDSTEQRGRAYLLLRHLIDQRAKAAGASNAASDTARGAAAQVMSTLISETAIGFEHDLFQTMGEDGAWAWLLGLYATCNESVTATAAHRYDFLAPGRWSVTGNVIGIAPFGRFAGASGQTIELAGPAATSDLTADSAETTVDGVLATSASQFFTLSGLDASLVQVTPDDSAAVLSYRSESLR